MALAPHPLCGLDRDLENAPTIKVNNFKQKQKRFATVLDDVSCHQNGFAVFFDLLNVDFENYVFSAWIDEEMIL